MGWSFPWYTDTLAFQEACGTTEYFKLQCFLRDGDDVYLTYETTSRGVEALGSVWTFLDLTPVRPPGGVGGHPARPPAGAAVPVVAQEGRTADDAPYAVFRELRPRKSVRPEPLGSTEKPHLT